MGEFTYWTFPKREKRQTEKKLIQANYTKRHWVLHMGSRMIELRMVWKYQQYLTQRSWLNCYPALNWKSRYAMNFIDKRTASRLYFCCFYDNGAIGNMRVFCKSIDSASWAMSNFNTHMNWHHDESINANVTSCQQDLKQIVICQWTDQIEKLEIAFELNKTPDESSSGIEDVLKVIGTNESICLFKVIRSIANPMWHHFQTFEAQSLTTSRKKKLDDFKDVLQRRAKHMNEKETCPFRFSFFRDTIHFVQNHSSEPSIATNESLIGISILKS